VTADWHVVEVDEQVFPLEIVLKASYWLTGEYEVDIQRNADRRLVVIRVRRAAAALSPDERVQLEAHLRRDLVDFRTRAVVESETRTLRELLVAKAFAHGDED
jgi:His-Xaa-Ser system protein HxsD